MQVKVFYEEAELNKWLDKNSERFFKFSVEEIRFAIGPDGEHRFMVVYTGEAQ